MKRALFAVVLCAGACGGSPEPKSPGSLLTPPPEPTTRVADPVPASEPTPVAPGPGPAEPAPSKEPPAASEATPGASSGPARPEGVRARSIGMHIGGGPNDAATKAPFTKTIESGFDDVLSCLGLVPEGQRGGTFGVDLLVPREGGKADVGNPRTGIPGAEFKACVVSVFERLVFEKPKRGATKLSYSLRFDSK